jgi:outer membrane protein assembly factor BamB
MRHIAFRRQLQFYSTLGVLVFILSATLATADDWPQWRGPDRDGIWKETGLIEKFDGDQIEHKWSVEISNGYSGPTVANGRVYVTDRMIEPKQIERVLCFDAETGAEVWKLEYDCAYKTIGYGDGPRSSVTIADGRAFAFGTMGHFFALDAATGEVLWKKEPDTDYKIPLPIWGMVAAPLIDGDNVIVQMGAKDGACVVALDIKTGEERWRAIDDKASYSPPIIVEQGDERVLVCWTGNGVHGLDPATGNVHWTMETEPEKVTINIAQPIVDGDRMFLTAFYDGAYMIRLGQDKPAIETLWRRVGRSERKTDALHSINSTPMILGNYIYGVDSYGELRCLDVKTGDRVWEDQTAVPRARWATIHMVQNGDKTWMFNEQGELTIAQLTPDGYNEISRAKLINTTDGQYTGTFSAVKKSEDDDVKKPITNNTGVTWSHPAYANKHVFIRNDTHLVCADLSAK